MQPRVEQYEAYISRLFHPTANGKDFGARTVTIQVTDACNLACTYCYQINKCTHSISLEAGYKFIDDLLDGNYNHYLDYSLSEGIVLEFIGGEPFLEIDKIDKFTDYFIDGLIKRNHPWLHRYRISICSNGVLYFDEKVQKYITKHAKHLSFSISIDGNKRLHDACRIFPDGSGSYDIAMAGVKHYMEKYPQEMGSKMTLAPGNIMHTAEAVQGLIESGYSEINLNCVYEEGWTVEHAKIMYQQLKELADYIFENQLEEELYLSIFEEHYFHPKDENDLQNWCGGTGSMLAVDWKGDLYPCIRYMESSLGDEVEPVILGNVWDGMLTTEHQCKMADCFNCVDRRTQSTDECFYCPIAEGCSWCSAYNYQLHGTPDKRATFICIMHKARALANAYFWNMYYRLKEPNKRFKIYIPDEWALEIIDQEELDMLKWLESPEQI